MYAWAYLWMLTTSAFGVNSTNYSPTMLDLWPFMSSGRTLKKSSHTCFQLYINDSTTSSLSTDDPNWITTSCNMMAHSHKIYEMCGSTKVVMNWQSNCMNPIWKPPLKLKTFLYPWHKARVIQTITLTSQIHQK